MGLIPDCGRAFPGVECLCQYIDGRTRKQHSREFVQAQCLCEIRIHADAVGVEEPGFDGDCLVITFFENFHHPVIGDHVGKIFFQHDHQ